MTAEFAARPLWLPEAPWVWGEWWQASPPPGGAHVIISGRDPARAACPAAVAECGGTADFVAADLAEVNDVQRLAEPVHRAASAP